MQEDRACLSHEWVKVVIFSLLMIDVFESFGTVVLFGFSRFISLRLLSAKHLFWLMVVRSASEFQSHSRLSLIFGFLGFLVYFGFAALCFDWSSSLVRGCPLQPVSDYDFTHVSVLLSTRISRITKLIVGNFTKFSPFLRFLGVVLPRIITISLSITLQCGGVLDWYIFATICCRVFMFLFKTDLTHVCCLRVMFVVCCDFLSCRSIIDRAAHYISD